VPGEGSAEGGDKGTLAPAAGDRTATSFADSQNSLADAEAASPVRGVRRVQEI
jgi:hypothetical protein